MSPPRRKKKIPFERYKDPRYNIWRVEVLKRDNYSCKTCGKTETLTVHHIKPYARYKALRYEVENGITLCSSCHKKIHSEIRKRRPKKKHSDKTKRKISESLKRYHETKPHYNSS